MHAHCKNNGKWDIHSSFHFEMAKLYATFSIQVKKESKIKYAMSPFNKVSEKTQQGNKQLQEFTISPSLCKSMIVKNA